MSKLNKAIAKQEETARDIAKLKGSLERTINKSSKVKVEDHELDERLDGEHGGRTFAKAPKKTKQWDAAEPAEGDEEQEAEDTGPRQATKVKAGEKNVGEREED